WTLHAGGSISRTVKGSVDFAQYNFPYPFKTVGLTNKSDYVMLEQITHFVLNPTEVNVSNWKDSEYDVFAYYFGANSGKFIFKDLNNAKTPCLLPYKPYIVTPVYRSNSYSNKLGGINILDDKGVLYQFAATGYYTDNKGFLVDNEFSLMKIISADKADTISFSYASFNQTRTTVNETITAVDKVSPPLASDKDILTGVNSVLSTSYDFYTISRLRQIDFKSGKVVFNLVTNSGKVDNIEIFDNKGNLIKGVKFNRSKLDASSAGTVSNITNKLDFIRFNDSQGTRVEDYSFEYYPTLSRSGSVTDILDLHYRDWWGYYNASGQHNLVPRYTNLEWVTTGNVSNDYGIGNTNADRNPRLAGAQSGVLKKITYPTGGSSEFIYELNRYRHYSSNQVKDGPGLRIYQIISNDKNGTKSLKTYKYGEDRTGYGTIDMVPEMVNMAQETHYYYFMPNDDRDPYNPAGTTYRKRVFYDTFIPRLKEIAA